MIEKVCKQCDRLYFARTSKSRICGSRRFKTGCIWLNRQAYRKSEKSKLSEKKAFKKYYEKNKELFRDYNRSWRENNRIKFRDKQRKRSLLKKGISGSHSIAEWENLKKEHNYNCVECGINETEIKKYYKFPYNKLTRDHKIPITKGGSDNIENIAPLCVSCNSRKKNRLIV